MSRTDTFEAMLARGQDGEMLRHTLGSAYLAGGDAPRAIEHLSRAVEMKPDWSAAWRALGRAHAAAGDHGAALVAFDRGAEVARANGDVQVGKEIAVFRRRSAKALASETAEGGAGAEADGAGGDAGNDAGNDAGDGVGNDGAERP